MNGHWGFASPTKKACVMDKSKGKPQRCWSMMESDSQLWDLFFSMHGYSLWAYQNDLIAFSPHRWMMRGQWGYKKIWNFPEVLDFRRRCRSKTWRLTSAPSRRCCLGVARVTWVTLKLGLCRFHSGCCYGKAAFWFGFWFGVWQLDNTKPIAIPGWCMNLCTITKKNHIEYLYRVYRFLQGSEVVIILLEMACLVGWDLADVFGIFVNLHEDQRGGRNPGQGVTISRIFSGLGSFYLLAVANETLREISGSCEVAVYVNLHEREQIYIWKIIISAVVSKKLMAIPSGKVTKRYGCPCLCQVRRMICISAGEFSWVFHLTLLMYWRVYADGNSG